MRGYRLAGAPPGLTPVERATPAPVGDEVWLEVEAAWLPPGASGPHVAGAAAIGRIVEAGDAAAGLRDRRALVGPTLGCGECAVCRRAAVAACPRGQTLGRDRDGALAERVLARGRWLCPLDERMPLAPLTGALVAGPAARAYAAYARAGLAPNLPAIVIGRGPVARALARIAVARGARVTIAAPDEPADAVAARVAADASGGGDPPTIFDAGEPGGAALAHALLAPAATLVLLAGEAPAALDLGALAARQATAIGVAGAHPDLATELAALVVRGELALDDLAQPIAWAELPALPALDPTRAAIVVR
jgi:threonine dehydrogenase-like Zn-dependent dehydrogenase